MSAERYKVRRVGTAWMVTFGTRLDPDLTDAFNVAVGQRALHTQRAAARLIGALMNTRLNRGEPLDAFITDDVEDGRLRINKLLRSVGHSVTPSDRVDHAYYVGLGKAGSMSGLSVGLKAIVRLYAALARAKLRTRANPARVDNYHLWTPLDVKQIKEELYGDAGSVRYAGSQYIVVEVPSSPLRIEDPIGLGPKVLAAGRAYGWPSAILDLVTVMADDGPRWDDTHHLTAADWARASTFRRVLLSSNKGSKRRRSKRTVITWATVAQLRRSFDADPDRPDMAELERLMAARDWGALERIHLFPSRLGTPHSYHVFNNEYFRPAMELAGVVIASIDSIVRPTAHRLRAARIQREADGIYAVERTDEEIAELEDQLRRDVNLKSRSAFERYLGELRERRADQARMLRQDRNAAQHHEPPRPTSPPRRRGPISSTQRRLDARAAKSGTSHA